MSQAKQVVIPGRFNGPPASAHGGYASGLVAGLIDAPGAAVSLRQPPPLDKPLEVHREEDGSVSLTGASGVVAIGAPSALSIDAPAIDVAAARRASAASEWIDRHPFSTCFGCGPDRQPPDALRLILGPVEGRAILADAWIPHRCLADSRGHVSRLFLWAALDCPTGAGAIPRSPSRICWRV